jgi:hypothetical protein
VPHDHSSLAKDCRSQSVQSRPMLQLSPQPAVIAITKADERAENRARTPIYDGDTEAEPAYVRSNILAFSLDTLLMLTSQLKLRAAARMVILSAVVSIV